MERWVSGWVSTLIEAGGKQRVSGGELGKGDNV